MAYNQFLLDSELQNFTCINTHRGLFNYTHGIWFNERAVHIPKSHG